MVLTAPGPWAGPRPHQVLVLGVEPGQRPAVLAGAARLAADLGLGLVCVWVDPAHVAVAHGPDGPFEVPPVDPDHVDDAEAPYVALLADLAAALHPAGVPWRFVYTVGEAAHGLAQVADDEAALAIVVGTRRPGFSGWMNQVIGGSVAGRLTHTQTRPVMVIP